MGQKNPSFLLLICTFEHVSSHLVCCFYLIYIFWRIEIFRDNMVISVFKQYSNGKSFGHCFQLLMFLLKTPKIKLPLPLCAPARFQYKIPSTFPYSDCTQLRIQLSYGTANAKQIQQCISLLSSSRPAALFEKEPQVRLFSTNRNRNS